MTACRPCLFLCLRSLRRLSLSSSSSSRLLPSYHQKRTYFYEPSKRGPLKYDKHRRDINEIQLESLMYWGAKIFWEDFKLWLKGWKEAYEYDHPVYEMNEDVPIWKFDNQEILDQWIVSKDADWGEGYSTAVLERSPAGHALFHGFLDTKNLPKDRTVTRSGWVFASCPPANRPFCADGWYDWQFFTHMVLRVRGDGRTYAISIRTPGTFDLTYFDVFTFALYTHGGPYWQYVKIPFSRFIFTSKGSAQDYQEPIDLSQVNSFGIGLMDKNHGPYRLEIDMVALQNDHAWDEVMQYEMYHVPQHKYPGY